MRKYLYPLFFLLINLSGYSQQLWTGPTIKLNINKKLRVEAEQQLRMEAQEFTYLSTFSEAAMRYKFFDHFAFKSSYRYTFEEEKNRQRVTGDLLYSLGSSKTAVVLGFRTRYQKTMRVAKEKETDYIRQNFDLEYNLTKRARPFTAFELFYRLNNFNEVRTLRFTLGLASEINKALTLTTFYRFEKERNVEEPQRNYIIGVMLAYKLKLKKGSQDTGIDKY